MTLDPKQHSDIVLYKFDNQTYFVVHRSFVSSDVFEVFCTNKRLRAHQKYIARSTPIANLGNYKPEVFESAKEKAIKIASL